jgi:thioredoxin 1
MLKHALRLLLFMTAMLLPAPVAWSADSSATAIPPVPTPGMVTLLDLGADQCAPCRLMAPIIAELKREYEGRVSILYIDVWRHPGQAQTFKIRAIPTLIFYNTEGKEVARSIGFTKKKNIVAILEKIGVSGK